MRAILPVVRSPAPIAALALALVAAPVRADDPRRVVLVEPAPGDAATAQLERALRPHLTAADATVHVVAGTPPADDDLARAAWGAEVAAREGADAVLWIEEDPAAGTLTLHLVDARARVSSVRADPGDRFDQVRTVALAVRPNVVRSLDRPRPVDPAPPADDDTDSTASRPAGARRRLAPSASLAALALASGQGATLGARAEFGLRIGRHLELRLGLAAVLPETLEGDNTEPATDRLRLPLSLAVGAILPLEGWALAGGVEGGLAIALLERPDGTEERTRVAPAVGATVAARLRASRAIFLEFPLSLRVRVAAPGSDRAYPADAVAPDVEASLGATLGIGG